MIWTKIWKEDHVTNRQAALKSNWFNPDEPSKDGYLHSLSASSFLPPLGIECGAEVEWLTSNWKITSLVPALPVHVLKCPKPPGGYKLALVWDRAGCQQWVNGNVTVKSTKYAIFTIYSLPLYWLLHPSIHPIPVTHNFLTL